MPDIDVILFLTQFLVFCIEEEKLEEKKKQQKRCVKCRWVTDSMPWTLT